MAFRTLRVGTIMLNNQNSHKLEVIRYDGATDNYLARDFVDGNEHWVTRHAIEDGLVSILGEGDSSCR